MRRQLRKTLVLVLVALTAAAGCNPAKPFYLRETGDLSHYLDKATEVEHPDVEAPHLAEVEHAEAPLTVTNPEFKEIWELGLEECMHIALQNSKVIRNAASIQANFGFSAALLDRTGQLPTVYDSAILESRTGGQAYQGRGAAGTTTFGSGLARALRLVRNKWRVLNPNWRHSTPSSIRRTSTKTAIAPATSNSPLFQAFHRCFAATT